MELLPDYQKKYGSKKQVNDILTFGTEGPKVLCKGTGADFHEMFVFVLI